MAASGSEEITDAKLLEMLEEEATLSRLRDEVAEAIAARLAKLAEGETLDKMAQDDVREQLFWKEELDKKLTESADARLAMLLLRDERAALGGSAGGEAKEGVPDAVALSRVEREFEDAMREREMESSEQLAARLEREERVQAELAARGAAPEPRSPKLRLARRLINRLQRRRLEF